MGKPRTSPASGRASSIVAAAAALALMAPAARAEGESGVSPSRLSLPSGPGSLEGVGENVSPNINMGLASYSVPIDIPAGQRGLSPSLSLGYSSSGGASIVGMGWSFGMPSIERMTSEGLPRYDALDKMAAGGGEELVRLPGTNTYRSRFESGFVRYRWIDTAADGRDGYWTSEFPDGRVAYYGARSDGTPRGDARVTGPDGTFRWHLSEMTDLFGHRVLYDYLKDGALSHIQRVAYAFDAKQHPRYVLAFEYEPRTDALVDAKPGFVTRMTRRLHAISIMSSDTVRRTYELLYQTEAQAGALTKLAAVYQYGLGHAGPYPIVFRFDYSDVWVPDCAGDACRAPKLVTLGAVGVDFRTGKADLIDMNGDGLPDVVDTTDGRHQIHIAEITPGGTHRLRAPFTSTVAGSGSAVLGAPNVQMVDLDGNGFTDLIDGNNGIVYRNRGLGDWQTAEPLEASLPDFASDVDLRFFDWNGDKAIDVLHADPSATWVVPNRGDGRYEAPVFTDDALGLGFATDGVQLADMNGDGLQDVVRVLDAAVAYRPNLGYGRFGDWEEMFGFPAVMPAEANFIDLDGDSLSDAVVVLGNEIRYAPNRSGTDFGDVVVLKSKPGLSLPERTSDISVRFADMNGNGSTDVVWIDASGKITYLELEPIRPNLLTRIRNGLGKVIELSYGASVLEMARDGGPDAWLRRLPQSHTVLKKLSHYDSLHVVREDQTFQYHDGYHDGVEQQFRGFEKVDVVTTGDESIEVGTMVHTFDVGVADRYLHGKEIATETISAGRSLQRTTTTFGDCPVAGVPANLDPPVRNVCELASESEVREGLPASQWVKSRSETVTDGFGNVTRTANLGVVSVGGHGCAPCAAATGPDADLQAGPCGDGCLGDESYSDSNFATPTITGGVVTGPWLLKNVTTTRTSGRLDGPIATETRTYYDGADLTGLPLGQVTRGLVSRRQQRVSVDRWIDAERNRFDAHGNLVEQIDAEGHRRRFGYDPLGLFTLDERVVFDDQTDPYELAMTTTIDRVQDKVLAATNWTLFEGGKVTSTPALRQYGYDAFGRLAWMSEPVDGVRDPAANPTTTYEYDLGDPVSRIIVRRRTKVGGPPEVETVMCLDGNGRIYQRRTREGATSDTYAITDYKLFDSRGAPAREYQPWMSTGASCDQIAPGDTTYRTYTRDALKRETTARFANPGDVDAPLLERNEFKPLQAWEWDVEDTQATSPHSDTPRVTTRDGLGRLSRVEMRAKDRSVTWSVDLAYDLLGNLARVTDHEGHVRRQTYDLAGRLVKVDDADSGVVTYTYDDTDNLISQTDARGVTMGFAYDEAGRLVSQWDTADPDGTRIVHHYDRDTGCAPWCTNTAGRRAFVEYPINGGARLVGKGRDINGYDPSGYPIRSRIELGKQSFDFTLEPDRLGRVVRAQYPGGFVLEFDYDARGHITRVPGYVDQVHYTAHGTVDEVHFANGTVTAYTEDALNRVERLETRGPDGIVLQDSEVSRDAVGNVIETRDLIARDGRPSGDALYAYDDRYRLVSATYDVVQPSLIERVDFTYDGIDNLTRMVSTRADSPAQVGDIAYGDVGGSPGGPHAALSAGTTTYDYDAAGNVIRRGSDAYEWDFMGRLAAVKRGAEVRERVVYGEGTERVAKVEGRRVSLYLGNDFEIRNGIATSYVSIGGHHAVKIERTSAAPALLGDLAPLAPSGSGDPIAPDGVVTAADAMVAARLDDGDLTIADVPEHSDPDEMLAAAALSTLIGPSERVTWMHDDIVGSTVLTTDARGREVARNEFYPYGQTRVASRGYQEEYSFSGKEKDAGSGLFYFGARYLDPVIGRWVSPDGHFGVLRADDAQSSEALNRYMFALDNPVTVRDADGNASMNNFNRNGNTAGLSAGNVQANYNHMLGFAWKIRTRERGTSIVVKLDVRLPQQKEPAKPMPAPERPKPEVIKKVTVEYANQYYKSKPPEGSGSNDSIKAVGDALSESGPSGRVLTITGRVNVGDGSGAETKAFRNKDNADLLQGARTNGALAAVIKDQMARGDFRPITVEMRGEDYAVAGSQGSRLSVNEKDGLDSHQLVKTFTIVPSEAALKAVEEAESQNYNAHNNASPEAMQATKGLPQ